jgi:hypothetical protein
MRREIRWLSAGLVLSLAACGGSEADTAEGAMNEPEATEVTNANQTAPPPTAAGLSAADLDAYERGMEAEARAVREAEAERARAATADDTLSALEKATETRTIEVGARAAGLSVDRYRDVRNQVDAVLRARGGSAFVQQQVAGMDTASMPPEHRARIRETIEQQRRQAEQTEQAAYASLSPEAAGVFRDRAARLDSLRMGLVAERMRVVNSR